MNEVTDWGGEAEGSTRGQNEEESLNIKDPTNTHLNGLGISHIDVDCKMLELLAMEIVRALQLLHVIKV